MVTHSDGYEVQTKVEIPGSNGTWDACGSLPDVLGEDMIKSCGDLSRVLVTQGGVVARLLGGKALRGFRLLAREPRTGALVGSVEWVRQPGGLWVQHDEPVTGCAYGLHVPRRSRLELVA
ncbi:hypothetical protein [Streptomyces californicus]|uniref:hypothetical protein n=1 Tax=Streptomyces californicus TaxID=67351 RepID=UPI0033BDEEE3